MDDDITCGYNMISNYLGGTQLFYNLYGIWSMEASWNLNDFPINSFIWFVNFPAITIFRSPKIIPKDPPFQSLPGLVNINKKRWKITIFHRKTMGKWRFTMLSMGKSTSSMIIFKSFFYVYQMVYPIHNPLNHMLKSH